MVFSQYREWHCIEWFSSGALLVSWLGKWISHVYKVEKLCPFVPKVLLFSLLSKDSYKVTLTSLLLRGGPGGWSPAFKALVTSWPSPSFPCRRKRARAFQGLSAAHPQVGQLQPLRARWKGLAAGRIWVLLRGKCPDKRITRPWCILPRESVESHYLVILMNKMQRFL